MSKSVCLKTHQKRKHKIRPDSSRKGTTVQQASFNHQSDVLSLAKKFPMHRSLEQDESGSSVYGFRHDSFVGAQQHSQRTPRTRTHCQLYASSFSDGLTEEG